MGHTVSIQLLLSTIQMASTRLQNHNRDKQQRSLAGRIQDSYFKCMENLSAMADGIGHGLQQGKQILNTTTEVLRINVQIFQAVVQLQSIVTQIPGQVERQQPVFLIDALGKPSPFHLEFIHSTKALAAVLADNFEKTGVAKRIQNGNFVIKDRLTGQTINAATDWDHSFFPGQKLEMLIVFTERDVEAPEWYDQNKTTYGLG